MRYTLTVLCFLSTGALAHDPKTHQANVLSDAKSSGGALCCSGHDYVIPSDWKRNDNGTYKVLLGKTWVDVPKDAEVKVPNPDFEAKVWISGSVMGVPMIRCFMAGGEV